MRYGANTAAVAVNVPLAMLFERARPDELMVTAQVFDYQARLKSYELPMEAVRQTKPGPAS